MLKFFKSLKHEKTEINTFLLCQRKVIGANDGWDIGGQRELPSCHTPDEFQQMLDSLKQSFNELEKTNHVNIIVTGRINDKEVNTNFGTVDAYHRFLSVHHLVVDNTYKQACEKK